MSEPTTEAGRRLLDEPWWSSRFQPTYEDMVPRILEIEAEARQLDVDRLAAALVETDPDNMDYLEDGETLGESFYREARPRAEAIAREYAASAEERLSE